MLEKVNQSPAIFNHFLVVEFYNQQNKKVKQEKIKYNERGEIIKKEVCCYA